ncbi:ATP synthase F(0) complex subunit f, mitochondrial [Ctenodactylus gundi]
MSAIRRRDQDSLFALLLLTFGIESAVKEERRRKLGIWGIAALQSEKTHLARARELSEVGARLRPCAAGLSGHRDVKMASVVPLKEKKLMDVKLGELPSWILMRDFTPKGIVGAFRGGYDRYYNKYINVKKGSIAGINMVLAAYVIFSYCLSYKELKHERLRKYH